MSSDCLMELRLDPRVHRLVQQITAPGHRRCQALGDATMSTGAKRHCLRPRQLQNGMLRYSVFYASLFLVLGLSPLDRGLPPKSARAEGVGTRVCHSTRSLQTSVASG